jgi:hypothetical protein
VSDYRWEFYKRRMIRHGGEMREGRGGDYVDEVSLG